MLRISKITDYAVVVLLDLYESGLDQIHSTRAVAERTSLPQTTVSKVMKLLQKADLITAQRGLCGGYQLALAPADITILQVIEAIEGPISLTTCSIPGSVECNTHAVCRAGPHWPIINNAVVQVLQGIQLVDLAKSPTPVEVLHGATSTSSL